MRRATVSAKPTPLHIVWFKRDLRIQDHRPLMEAARRGAALPLYVVEPALWREPDSSARHWRFILECLSELDAALARLGQPLVVRVGTIPEVLDEIRRSHGIAALWSHEETGNAWTFARDKAVAAWAQANGVPWHELPQFGVQRRLTSRNGWAAAWDRQMSEAIVDPPSALQPVAGMAAQALPMTGDLGLADDGCFLRQPGGRRAGLDLLDTFLAGRGQTYRRDMSNPLAGATACSRLSPHLAWGTVSMREVAQATWTRLRDLRGEAEPGAKALRASLVSFSGRLHWHCHFMQKLESAPSIEVRELHPALRGLRPAAADPDLLAAWANGQTGYPFLDACMRSLAATGWLNFRMRAMVMSFASYNLWLPWRDTGLHLARQFTDYEPGIHWPQTQMQSGTTGINTIRIYSVIKQGHDQDPNGAFVRRWIPELADVPDQHLQEPWGWDGAGSIIGRTYPERIVDLKASTAAAKDKIYSARRGAAFHAAADAIQDKHGSRKSNIPMTGQRRKQAARKRKPAAKKNPDQTELDL
jgi:deoxyribodipyrimidine photo-lyase